MAHESKPQLDNIEELSVSKTSMVIKLDGDYIPLFSPEDVNRDSFIQLRKELIDLGCSPSEVITIAKRLSMQVLNLSNESDYHAFILTQTYRKCLHLINHACNPFPIQDISNGEYSHTQLFASVYGFEINYLKHHNLLENIGDVGCGDGLFLKLLKDHNIEAEGYEIEIKKILHPVKINHIQDITDIEFKDVIILNHVLEHITEHPNKFLHRLLTHLNSLTSKRVKAVLISLPIHFSLQAHLAADHRWICHSQDIPSAVKELLLKEVLMKKRIQLYHPDKELKKVAEQHGYSLKVQKNIGTYVIE